MKNSERFRNIQWLHKPRDIWWIPPSVERLKEIKATNPILEVTSSHLRNDTGGLNVDSGFLGSEGTEGSPTANDQNIDFDTVYRLRQTVDEIAGKNNEFISAGEVLNYRIDGGSWTPVASGDVRLAASDNISGTGACTTQLNGSPGSGGSWDNGGPAWEAGSSPPLNTYAKDVFWETEFAFQVVSSGSLTGGETVEFLWIGGYSSGTESNHVISTYTLNSPPVGNDYDITGAATVALTIAATLIFAVNSLIAGAVTVTIDPTAGAAEETGTLFASGFEDETDAFTVDFDGKWTEAGNTALIESTIVRSGGKSAKCSFGGTNSSAIIEKTGLGNLTEIYVRQYFRIDDWGQGGTVQFVTIRNSAVAVLFEARIDGTASPWTLTLRNWITSENIGTSVSFAEGVWHRLELHYKEDTDGTDGVLEGWLNGVSFASNTTTDWESNTVDRVDLGPTSSGVPIDGAAAYFDDVRFEETGPIGAFAGDGLVYTQNASIVGAVTVTVSPVAGGSTYLSLPGEDGDNASTPDSAAVSVTGDIDLRVDMAADDYTVAENTVFGKSQGFGTGEAYYTRVTGATPRMGWSEDGVTLTYDKSATTAMTGLSAEDRIHVRITLDVDVGGTDSDLNFYWRNVAAAEANALDSDSNWTQLGTTVTQGAITNIFDGDLALIVGNMKINGGFGNFAGKVYRAMIYNGISGTIAYDARFDQEDAGTTSFDESSVNAATVTINQSGDPYAEIVGGGLIYTQNASIVGAVTVTVTPASGMIYATSGNNYTITGDVTVTTAVAATLDYTLNASVDGAITVTVVPAASALEYNLNASIDGAVTVTTAVAADMEYAANHIIAGAVTVSTVVAAVMAYNLNATIPGAVTVTIDPTASALEYNLNASIAGAVTVDTTVASAMQYSAGSGDYTIAGDVTVTTSVAAAMEYASNHIIAGDVTVTVVPTASDLSYNLNASIDGAVTLDVAVAGVMDYNLNASIAGDVTVTASVAAALDYTLNADITGAVTVSVAPAASMFYSSGNAILGDITVTVGPSTGPLLSDVSILFHDTSYLWSDVGTVMDYTLNRDITGDITVTTSVASAMEFSGTNQISGDITVTVAPAATMAYNLNASIDGAVTVPITVASAMQYTVGSGDYEIVGAVTVSTSVAAAMEYAVNYAIDGAVTVTTAVAAAMLYASGYQIAGDITVSVTPSSTMVYNQHPVIAGAVVVSVVPAASMDFTGGYSIVGAIPVSVTPSASMLYRSYEQVTAEIVGDITVHLITRSVMDAGWRPAPGEGGTWTPIPSDSYLWTPDEADGDWT